MRIARCLALAFAALLLLSSVSALAAVDESVVRVVQKLHVTHWRFSEAGEIIALMDDTPLVPGWNGVKVAGGYRKVADFKPEDYAALELLEEVQEGDTTFALYRGEAGGYLALARVDTTIICAQYVNDADSEAYLASGGPTEDVYAYITHFAFGISAGSTLDAYFLDGTMVHGSSADESGDVWDVWERTDDGCLMPRFEACTGK